MGYYYDYYDEEFVDDAEINFIVEDEEDYERFYQKLMKSDFYGYEIDKSTIKLNDETTMNWNEHNLADLVLLLKQNDIKVEPFVVVQVGEVLNDITKYVYDGKFVTDHRAKLVFE